MADLSIQLGDINIEQHEHVAYEPGMVSWGDETSGTTHRFQLGSSEQFTLERVELTELSGATSTNASVDVRTQAGSLGSANLGESNTPDATSASGATVEVSLSNNTGEGVTAAPTVRGHIN